MSKPFLILAASLLALALSTTASGQPESTKESENSAKAAPLPALPAVVKQTSVLPYALTDAHARKAVLAEGAGKWKRARREWKKAKSVPRPARNYVQAVLLERQGKKKDALRKQIAIAGGDWPLRHHAAYRAALLLREEGRCREAIPFYRQAMGAGSLRGEAAIDLMWCLQQEGREKEALDNGMKVIDQIVDRYQRRRLQLMVAHLLVRMDKKDVALPMLHDLHFHHRMEGDLAGKALAALYGEEWSRMELFECMLTDGRRTWQERLQKLPEEPSKDWDKYRKAMYTGWIQNRRRQREESLVNFRGAMELAQTPLETAMATYFTGRTLEALDKDIAARELYDQLLKDYPTFPLARQLLVRNATISIREGEAVAGLGYIDLFLDTRYPGEDCSEMLWLKGFVHYLAGSYLFAEGAWKELQERYFYHPRSPWEYYGPMALFWRSEAMRKQNKESEARSLLHFLVSEWAGSYYAVLAAQRLAELGENVPPWLPADATVSPASGPELLPVTEGYKGAVELYRLGMWEEAYREIHAVIPMEHFEGVAEWMSTTWFRFHSHRDTLRYRRAVGTLPAPWKSGARLWWRSVPLDYVEVVTGAAAESGVPAALLATMIRFESNFTPDARSGAGAEGLIQLKFDTAQAVGQACLKKKRLSRRNVLDPEMNVRIGAIYMRELLVRHHGHVGIALAAFNAGPGAAGWWLARFAGLIPSTLVEQITYPRTVGYLKRIIGAMPIYWSLYHPALGWEPLHPGLADECPRELAPFLDEEGGTCYTPDH